MKKIKLFGLFVTGLLVFGCQSETIDEVNEPSSKATELSRQSGLNFSSYLVISQDDNVSDELKNNIRSKKGNILSEISSVGVVIVESSDPNFITSAKKIKGVRSVVPNLELEWIDPNERKEVMSEDFGNPPSSGDDDIRFELQWGHDAVDAPEAWNAGYRGAGTRVGILDGGFDTDHPDLQPNINFELSADFTGEGLEYSLPNTFSHGSHTAGTVAAADNGFGTIGIAPEAELVLIKVLGDAGSGSIGNILAGMIYAADNDVDVINMSLGSTLSRRGGVYNSSGDYLGSAGASAIAEYITLYQRVANYVYQKGTTIIASAGNAGTDYDHSKDLIHLPSDLAHVISISATAPIGWATNPQGTFLDNLASYSNYGQSTIDFAAPGGDSQYPGNEFCQVGRFVAPCWAYDLVYSTGNNGWYWSAGTSMASPHAAGVAAIIIGKNGGDMNPSQVEAAMRASADDLGKPGNDPIYGKGRVNAYNAVRN